MYDNLTTNKITGALAWSFAAEIVAKLIVPMSNMILARILDPNSFGVIASINMIISFADMTSTYGVSRYVIQREFRTKEELYRNADVSFWTNVLISIVFWLVIVFFSESITSFIGSPGYEKALIIAAISLPLTGFSSVQEAFFQRLLNFKALFYRRLIVSFLPFFVTVPLAFMGLGYWSLIIGTLVSNVIKIVILCFYSPWNPSFFYDFNILKKMFSFCAWMFMVAVSSWSVYYIDIFFVSKKMGEYYTGLYTNSQIIVTGIISLVTASATSVLFASLSREQNNNDKFKNIFYKFQKNFSVLLLPMGVLMYFFSDIITNILLGSKWMEASPLIGIWSLSTVLFCLFADFCKEAFKAKGKPHIIFYIQIFHLFFMILLCNYAVEKGFLFLGITRALGNTIIIFVYLILLRIYFNISILKILIEIKEPLICSIFIGIIANCLLNINKQYIYHLIYVIICAISYLFALSCFKQYRTKILNFISSLILVLNKKLKKREVNG